MSAPIDGVRCVLTDIEGTTTSIRFVYDVLFPYFNAHLPSLLDLRDDAEVSDAFSIIKREQQLDDDASVLAQLREWVAADVKHTQLKRLQGILWRRAYESGEIKGHVYDDVPVQLKRWYEAGIQLAVYSSGSVAAQQLLFGHSEAGDLRPLFSHYFDTRMGHKRECDAYMAICEALKHKAAEILFLSDVPAELAAAEQAGMQTIQLVRPGTEPDKQYRQAKNFYDIPLLPSSNQA